MSLKRILFGLVLLGAIGVVFVLNMGPKEIVKIQVQSEKARFEPITQVVTASGKIKPETEVKVAADVGGYIRKLTVEEGDQVKAGDLLVEIDTEIYQARVMESQAAEQTARANLMLSEATLKRTQGEQRRIQGLYKKDLTSRAELERGQSDLAIAEAEVEAAKGRLLQAQAALEKARKDLAKCTIRASIDGTVVLLNKEPGERASGGDFREDIILNLADLSSMEVEVEVSERDVVLISLKNSVDIEVDAFVGETIQGYVKEIANAGTTRNPWTESEVTNFRVVVQVGPTDLKLRPQMSATVRIRTAHKERALTVPIQSVTLRRPSQFRDKPKRISGTSADQAPMRGKKTLGEKQPRQPETPAGREEPVEVVFVIEDGKVLAKPVKTGLSSDTRIEILEGISENTPVVSGPYRALSKDLEHLAQVQVAEQKRPTKNGRKHRPKGG